MIPSEIPTTPDAAGTSDDTDSRLALCLASLTESEPDLAKIIAAWPTLPAPIRRGILALIE